ncbi:MAG: nucleotidyltransferase [Myxococcales bacterium]|nr:nucleotidyltransferase [Myxococcales bacterium]
MGLSELLGAVKVAALLALGREHGARSVRLFGSAARGEARPDSDIDLLVEMEPGRTLLDLVAFAQDAEELIDRRVDVVTPDGLSPHLRHRILAEAIPL